MLQKFFHFTITSDARRQIPKMIIERLVDEYIWQGQEYLRGTASVQDRAKRIRQLIEAEITRRNAQREFEKLLSKNTPEEKQEQVM